jgi:hypothetical protein
MLPAFTACILQVIVTEPPAGIGVAGALGQDADTATNVCGTRVRDARDHKSSASRCEDRGEHADRRRLPGAVRTEHAEDLSSLDGERQIFDCDETAVLLAHAVRFDDRAHPLIRPSLMREAKSPI